MFACHLLVASCHQLTKAHMTMKILLTIILVGRLVVGLLLLLLLGLVQHVKSLATPPPPTTTTTISSVPLGTLQVFPVALGSLNLDFNNPDHIVRLLQSLPRHVDNDGVTTMTTTTKTLLDTAEVYGNHQAEAALAKAVQLAGVQDQVVYSAKFAPQLQRSSPQSIVAACQASARRLQVDCIDLYQVHYTDSLLPLVQLGWTKEKDDIYWNGLADCYHSGFAANIGVCNYGPSMLRRAYEALTVQRNVPLVSNQIGYNLMRLGITQETKLVCDELDITVLGYSPLGKGTLCGTYNPEDISTIPKPSFSYYRYVRCLKETTELRAVLQQIATTRQMSWPSICYNWARTKNVLPIAGAKTVAQVQDIVDAMGWSLTEQEVQSLDAVAGYDISPGREFVLN
jgi:pyridoxine 4-dehydrogenase